ncbi:hypothetical protein ACFP9V_18495 [Deinococcus radiopugnans]|uniref:Uncharacterized protein n=1 Tax=Deinococcus radiopugnans ATCC 19172 TaxID=585398 RepID=A0A5C4Y8T7_9DEIO|nr:hypothetical protein [Deinococcus radiopugnans]MBB6017451.1 hypothetical protein [Deinococcus radiopugnans ATCC 19172]TNM71979.1 hypothetical protein FHR04_06345 [Deinococcus radiopugnans ATCC 19172]
MKNNILFELTIAVPVRRMPVEPASPEPRVLAQVDEGGYQQQVVGRASDLPATLAWLEEQAMQRSG